MSKAGFFPFRFSQSHWDYQFKELLCFLLQRIEGRADLQHGWVRHKITWEVVSLHYYLLDSMLQLSLAQRKDMERLQQSQVFTLRSLETYYIYLRPLETCIYYLTCGIQIYKVTLFFFLLNYRATKLFQDCQCPPSCNSESSLLVHWRLDSTSKPACFLPTDLFSSLYGQ